MANWVETKKESAIDAGGTVVTETVTLEPEKEKENPWKYKPKELIDLALRIIGILAIAVPVFLFYKGQQAERDKQKALFQLQIYADATTIMHELAEKRPATPEFEQNKNKLFYEIYPKLRLLNDRPIVDTFRILKDIIEFSSMAYTLFNNADSLYELLRPVSGLNPFEETDPLYFKDLADKLGVMRGRSLTLMYKIGDWENDTDLSKKYINSYVPELDSMNKKFFEALDKESKIAKFILNKMRTKTDSTRWTMQEPEGDLLDNITETRYDYEAHVKKFLRPFTSKIDSMMIRSSRLLYNQ